jgi:U3 small nucleolar RNA-associated protein 7
MDSLIAQADAIAPINKRRKTAGPAHTKSGRQPKSSGPTPTLSSILNQTALPKSLRPTSPLPEDIPKHNHIPNKKLRAELTRRAAHNARSKVLLKDAELLLVEEAGLMEVEGEMERTWRVGQEAIVNETGQEAARGRRELKLDGGPYRSRYTRNGR